MNNLLDIKLTLLSSQSTPDGFEIQIQGLKIEDKIELRGANIYSLSGHTDKFIVIPIFPPVFQEGSLRCRGVHLKWFIDTDRNIYMIDSMVKGAVLKNGGWVYISAPSFIPSINACIGFLEWLESEHERLGRGDALIQTLIVINDEDSSGFPQWLIEVPFFLGRWVDYKAYYKNLCQFR